MTYEINCNTLALIPLSYKETKVVELNDIFKIKRNSMEIIKDSCEYFGSTYLGRHEGTKSLIGVSHKSPIIIEESNNIIYFPTASPRLLNCSWISLNSIKNYKENKGKTEVIFINDKRIIFNISYGSFDNQYLRATKLESVLRKRMNKNDKN